jgi:hypothetical protein
MRRPLALAAWLALALACTFDGSALLSAGPPTSDGTLSGDSATNTGAGASTGNVTTGVDTGGGTGSGTTTALPETTAVAPASSGTGGPVCGDGALQADEECDGADLGGKSCADFGLGAGALACSAACTIDLGGCAPPQTCGDGTLDGDEQCEGTDLGGQTCAGLGFTGGDLACAANCTFDTAACSNAPPQWYDPYPKRRALTIAKSRVKGSHTDFPVAVVITDAAVLASLGALDKLAFTDANNLKISHELAIAEASRLVVWVELPSLSDAADTLFYVYYGDAAAKNVADPKATWSNGFLGVWHLDEPVPDEKNSGKHVDSTEGGHDGTQHGNQGAEGARVGRCQYLGDADWIEVAKPADFKLGDVDATITAWVHLDDFFPDPAGIFVKSNPNAAEDGQMILGANDPEKLAFEQRGVGTLQGSSDIQDKNWHFVAWTQLKDDVGAAERWRLYVDGAEQTNGTFTTQPTKDGHLVRLGGATSGSTFPSSLKGDLDEVHVALAARSGDWLVTAYNNQGNPPAFVAVGPEQPKP